MRTYESRRPAEGGYDYRMEERTRRYPDYEQRSYGTRQQGRSDGEGYRGDRDFLDRMSDEMSSWFGDEQATRRRRYDKSRERAEERRHRGGNGSPGEWQDEIRVGDVMTQDVVTVMPDDTVERASRLMRECDCGALPVVGWGGRLLGMITDRDIAIRLVARGADTRRARVSECMTDEVFSCHLSDRLEDCMRQMSRHQIRRLPIVDDERRVVGIVSQGDLARHAAEHPGAGERRAVAEVLCAVSEPSAGAYR